MSATDQSGQTVHGPQVNAGRDATIERIGDSYNYDIKDAHFDVPAEVVRQFLIAAGIEPPEDLAVAELGTMPWEPDTVFVPAGAFFMGTRPGKGIPAAETPQFEVTLPAYRIGYRPVSNAEYHHYLQQIGRTAPPELGWKYGTNPAEEQEAQPVRGVTWHNAMAYCEWLAEVTGRAYTLPSEAQWERAVIQDGDPLAMLDNVREWTTTLWGEKRRAPDKRYQYPWQPDDGRDNVKANDMVRRVTRGGTTRPTRRTSDFPNNRGWNGHRIGFRVVINQEN